MTLQSIAWAAGVFGILSIAKGMFLRRRFARLAFDGGGCGPRGSAPFGGHHRGGRGWAPWARRGIGRSFWLRAVFARLDTTPGQEREIRAALEDMQERARDAKTSLPEARTNVARAVRGDEVDLGALEAASARLDATSEMMKDAFNGALKRIHAVLDSRQRERLADLIGKGFGHRGWGRNEGSGEGGPYRSTPAV
ncbi:MAG: hypothetical protein JWP97_2634 [Labilithrix sp.]|nr:hypothetical protein [Labilithrix sp.]